MQGYPETDSDSILHTDFGVNNFHILLSVLCRNFSLVRVNDDSTSEVSGCS